MKLKPQLSQTQKLQFNTKMYQQIELLQMTHQEMHSWIESEYNENPFLEWQEKTSEIAHYLASTSGRSQTLSSQGNQQVKDWLLESIAAEQTLADSLKLQIRLIPSLSNEVREASFWIIDSLDSSGYLRMNIEALKISLKATYAISNQALQLVQSLDPAGVGARDLEECLTLQLHRLEGVPPSVYELIQHLDRLKQISLEDLALELRRDISLLLEDLKWIQRLNPKPGNGFSEAPISFDFHVQPDYVVQKKANHQWEILFSDTYQPYLQISPAYRELLSLESAAGNFSRARFQRALWVIKMIEQRRLLLIRIGDELLKHQENFFEKGSLYLKPLTQTTLAEIIEVHPSTISRAVNGKWLHCSLGLFPIRFFLSSGNKKRKSSENLSRTAIKEHMKLIIKKENSTAPYTDEDIVRLLQSKQISISRRTVAKYREECGIPSSSRRIAR